MTKIELYKCDDCGKRIEVTGSEKLLRWLQRSFDSPPIILDLCYSCHSGRRDAWRDAMCVLSGGGPMPDDSLLLLSREAYEFIGQYVRKEGKKK